MRRYLWEIAKGGAHISQKAVDHALQFVDKEGNVYKRLKPMNTNKVYTNTGDTMQKEVKKHSKAIPVVAEQPAQPKVSGIALAKQILKGKAIDYIQNNNFNLAKELLDVVDQIKE